MSIKRVQSSSAFTYDASGRLTGCSQPGEHTFRYAPNDMPVQMKSGRVTANYCYLADGTKLSRSLTRITLIRPYRKITSTTYDVGSFRFTQSGANGSPVLDRISLPWGYFDNNLQANVYIKDYQSNIRAVYNQDESEIIQQTDYYPYGLPKAKSIAPEINPFKYSGKELYTDLPLHHYDFAARLQLPAFGLFQRPDPKAIYNTWLNTYSYCRANPINNIDPDGKLEWPVPETYNGGTRRHENNFGAPRDHGRRSHKGVDINIGVGAQDLGAPVYATHDGEIIGINRATDGNSGGNRVHILSHNGVITTSYIAP